MPRYTPDNTRGGDVEIFIDGQKAEEVMEADDDLGFIVIRDRDVPIGKRLITGQVIVTFGRKDK